MSSGVKGVKSVKASVNNDEAPRPEAKPTILPLEIVSKIIHYLALSQNKDPLAKCMRVSPAFNAIIAPHLYRSLHLIKHPGTLYGYTAEENRDRKTLTKFELIGLAKEVAVGWHDQEGDACRPLVQKKVKWKGFTLLLFGRGYGQHDRCPCFALMSPNKVVSRRGLQSPLPPSLLHNSTLETVVLITEPGCYPRESRFRHDAPHSERPLQIVYIFLTPGANTRSYIPNSSDPMGAICRSQLELRMYVCGLEAAAKRASCRHDFLVVNTESFSPIWASQLRDAGTTVTEYSNGYAQRLANNRSLHAAQSLPTPASDRAVSSTTPEAETNIKFIDMETYLENYDWKGNFSPEEVGGWSMQIEDRKELNRKEKEEDIAEAEGRRD